MQQWRKWSKIWFFTLNNILTQAACRKIFLCPIHNTSIVQSTNVTFWISLCEWNSGLLMGRFQGAAGSLQHRAHHPCRTGALKLKFPLSPSNAGLEPQLLGMMVAALKQECYIDMHQLKLCSSPSLPLPILLLILILTPILLLILTLLHPSSARTGREGPQGKQELSISYRNGNLAVLLVFSGSQELLCVTLAVYWAKFPGGIVWEVLAQVVQWGCTLGSALKVPWKLLRSGNCGVCVPLLFHPALRWQMFLTCLPQHPPAVVKPYFCKKREAENITQTQEMQGRGSGHLSVVKGERRMCLQVNDFFFWCWRAILSPLWVRTRGCSVPIAGTGKRELWHTPGLCPLSC